MKIKFSSKLQYQLDAIRSVVDLFKGNRVNRSNFTVEDYYKKDSSGRLFTDLGIGNRFSSLFDAENVLNNMNDVQLKNGLPKTNDFSGGNLDFSIEMETGTGKTYVYLRTIFELNKQYGFTKFLIVVPSKAIKHGVLKSLDIMGDHFKMLYDNVPFEFSEYSSKNIELTRDFAVSQHIKIMVINIDSFNKERNKFNDVNDKLGGNKPLDLVKETAPIVIIDEPQSVVSTEKGKESVKSLNPLFTLRYSATHKEKINLVYKLDSIEAYNQKLVKKIEVASVLSKEDNNKAYMKLLSVDNKGSRRSAKIEIDVWSKKDGIVKVTKKIKTVYENTDLFDTSNNREQYQGYIIDEIDTTPEQECIYFSNDKNLRLGQIVGRIDEEQIKKKQIERTIKEHLDKELKLRHKGIKVLSLFFIDKVANYRKYDENGEKIKGKYAVWFEELYKKEISKPKYHRLIENMKIDVETMAGDVHNGYFSCDKSGKNKGKFKDTSGKSSEDESAFELIMKDKEKLLSFNSKLKFIFSHSTLKEGWDNPNVFQICTLNETTSEMKKRQEIGRGLRIAVNQNGERKHGFDINTLTVVSNEAYEDFARTLQSEIETDAGVVFGVVEKHHFANIVISYDENDNPQYLGTEASESIWGYLVEHRYVDKKNKITNVLKLDLKEDRLDIPLEYMDFKNQIVEKICEVAGNLNIANADKKRTIKLQKQVLLDENFKELWDNIKYKTTYSVNYDSNELVDNSVKVLRDRLLVEKPKLLETKADIDQNKGGINTRETYRRATSVVDDYQDLPDILTMLQNTTKLTRRTLVKILIESEKLYQFKNNPQKFIDEVAMYINMELRKLLVSGIKYERIGDAEYYSQELFKDDELTAYLEERLVESHKSPFEYVKCDSKLESDFAKRFEDNESVKVYTKLPSEFKIDTPIGYYNPDWAVLVEQDGEKKLFFVVETKGTLFIEGLRPTERMKIECGEKHFKAINTKVKYEVANDFDSFIEGVNE